MAHVKGASAWLVLIVILFVAGGGVSLIRYGLIQAEWWAIPLGALLTILGTAYLGGFIYYRDKKRGRIKRPDLFRSQNVNKEK